MMVYLYQLQHFNINNSNHMIHNIIVKYSLIMTHYFEADTSNSDF